MYAVTKEECHRINPMQVGMDLCLWFLYPLFCQLCLLNHAWRIVLKLYSFLTLNVTAQNNTTTNW